MGRETPTLTYINLSLSLPALNPHIHEAHPENIEALQYLEALCRDLGRPADDYSKKLEKLRRALPNPAATQAGMAASRLVYIARSTPPNTPHPTPNPQTQAA